MSWLSGLAGKAEDLLVRVDQAAGKALTNQPDDKPPPKSAVGGVDPSFARADVRSKVTAEATNAQQQIPRIPSTTQLTSTYGGAAGIQAKSVSNKPSAGSLKGKDKDEELFRFLNTNAPAASTNTSAKNSISSGRHSRASSTSSTVSSRIEQLADASADMSYAASESKRGDDEGEGNDLGGDNGASAYESSSGYHSNADTNSMGGEPLSDMEVENHMLKKEIASLNHEIQSIIHRSKDAQEEIKHLNAKLSQQHHQLLVTEQMARDLREQNTDTQELMKAKDAQLAVLRVRLDEADRRLTERQLAVDDVEKEKRRLLEDHSTASSVHSQALTTLQEKLQRAEMNAARDNEHHQQVQKEYLERQSKLESEVRTLAETVESLQKKLQEEKNKNWDSSSQLKLAKSHLDNAKQELSDYKEKAARILQAKEKLITMLKEGGGEGGGGASGVPTVSLAEVDGLRQEKEMLHEELQQARMTIDSLRTEIAELETQMQQESSTMQDQVQSVEEQLRSERLRCQDFEQDLVRLKQELNYAREESTKVKVALQTRIQDREEEIGRLRLQMTTRSMNTNNSQQELENRLHALTESLIQKQTAIESLHTERNSLTVQLERMEKQYRELEATAIRSSSAVINVNDDDAVRQRVPAFMRETPMDGNMARKVKRAANSIDRFSIWLGVFLHRFPMARIVVIVYMLFLHLWVTFVLLTYKPEIHAGDDHLPSP